MRTTTTARSDGGGFTKLDLTVLVSFMVVGALFAGLVLRVRYSRPRPSHITCVSNLKQIGLAFRLWSNDHGGQFPQTVSTNMGGSMEWTGAGEAFRHFEVVSNELVSPKVLTCPNDAGAKRCADWSVFGPASLSYFAGLTASETKLESLLAGDRHVTGGGSGLVREWADPEAIDAGWLNSVHGGRGNVGLGDGSALQVAEGGLQNQIRLALVEGGRPVRVQLPRL